MADIELLEIADGLIDKITENELQYPDLALAAELAQQIREELGTVFGE